MLLHNDPRVDSDGDRFLESMRICDFLEEIANSDGFEQTVAIGSTRRSLSSNFAVRTYHAYKAHRFRLCRVHEHRCRQYEKCLIYFAVTGISTNID